MMNRLGKAAGSVRVHSCGHSDHLFDQIQKLDHLTCLNIGSNTSIKQAREKFGRDIKIDLIPDMHLLNEGQKDDIRKWIDGCLDDNNDGPLDIQFHYDVGMPFKNIEAIFTALVERGILYGYDSLVSRWAGESI